MNLPLRNLEPTARELLANPRQITCRKSCFLWRRRSRTSVGSILRLKLYAELTRTPVDDQGAIKMRRKQFHQTRQSYRKKSHHRVNDHLSFTKMQLKPFYCNRSELSKLTLQMIQLKATANLSLQLWHLLTISASSATGRNLASASQNGAKSTKEKLNKSQWQRLWNAKVRNSDL